MNDKPISDEEWAASFIEQWIRIEVKDSQYVKEAKLAARDAFIAAILAKKRKWEDALLYEITADLYEIADQEEGPKLVWERHRKYLDRLARSQAQKGSKVDE